MIGFIIGLVLAGLFVGALGRLLHPGRDPIGIGGTIAVGVLAMLFVGIVLHGALGPVLSFVLAVVVAAVIVAIWARFAAPDARHRSLWR